MLSFIILIFINTQLWAKDQHSSFDKMMMVNKEWNNQPDVVPKDLPFISENNHRKLIARHLEMVEHFLGARDVNHLTSKQKENRKKALNHLHQYRLSQAFPINNQYDYNTPIFIDAFDNFCAVGYLIKSTGYESVARMIAKSDNIAYVKTMNYKELDDWAKAFGFTKDELAWIQPGYDPTYKVANLGKGFDSEVEKLFPLNDKLYAVGNFLTADSTIITNGIAFIEKDGADYTYHNVGNGVVGSVNTIIENNGQLVIAGSFSIDATTDNQGVATWDGNQWNPLGCIKGNIKELVEFENELYAVGNFEICDSAGTVSGNFAKWDGTDWSFISGIEDSINTAIVYNAAIYLGGYFTINDKLRNIAKWNPTHGIQAFEIDTIQEINDFEIAWNQLYAVGKQREMNDRKHLFLVYDGSWKPVYQFNDEYNVVGINNGNDAIIINSLTLIEDKLYAAGDFNISNYILYGNNSNFVYHSSYSAPAFEQYNYLSFSVGGSLNSIAKYDGKIFVAGLFSSSYGNTNAVNNIGYVNPYPIGIPEHKKMQVNIYPNPVLNGKLNIDQLNQKAELKVYNMLSQVMGVYPLQANNNTVDLQHYNSGNYFIEIVNAQGQVFKSIFQVLK